VRLLIFIQFACVAYFFLYERFSTIYWLSREIRIVLAHFYKYFIAILLFRFIQIVFTYKWHVKKNQHIISRLWRHDSIWLRWVLRSLKRDITLRIWEIGLDNSLFRPHTICWPVKTGVWKRIKCEVIVHAKSFRLQHYRKISITR